MFGVRSLPRPGTPAGHEHGLSSPGRLREGEDGAWGVVWLPVSALLPRLRDQRALVHRGLVRGPFS